MFTIVMPTILGDKTPIGWTITIAYFVTTAITWLAFRVALHRQPHAGRNLDARFWGVVSAIMLSLGINKQLDLQRAITRYGRQVAMDLHIWEHRRPLQAAFILCIVLAGLMIVTYVASQMRELGRCQRVALLGLGCLGVFVVARAASFHHVDVVLGLKFHNVYVNTVLELGGILWVAWAAAASLAFERAKDKARSN